MVRPQGHRFGSDVTAGPHGAVVRAGPPAGAAAGVDVRAVKIAAFAISSFIASVAGTLYGYDFGSVSAARFTALAALGLIRFAYIGGITMVSGAVIAGLMSTEALLPHALRGPAHRCLPAARRHTIRRRPVRGRHHHTGAIMSTPVLEVSGLTAGYEGAPVIRDVDLTVAAGQVVALLGANGAGKTTTPSARWPATAGRWDGRGIVRHSHTLV
ncbi:ATP-binding cassette domain-containing protein [Streptomyces sp. Li-HN-5-11]|uniref:ATP-binding cassette domain-containing protein n=1 Tax=Streptomyces sp. Li-HN-5-11 TaxID=3075432 RepID=UPI0028A5AFD7|nr:ATP-binding cassette domain-containing protein [Streptomyces sp. Li-HN-5-11]WNM33627.1 ATP-binding cassette domain-containing protein [Streptomyces sp. Li-HN-5-11]